MNQITRKFKLCKTISTSRYVATQAIMGLVDAGLLTKGELVFEDAFKQSHNKKGGIYHTPITKEALINYEHGNSVSIEYLDAVTTKVIVKVYYCDSFSGDRESLKYVITGQAPTKEVVGLFKKTIEAAFDYLVDEEFTKQEELRILEDKKRIAKKLLQ